MSKKKQYGILVEEKDVCHRLIIEKSLHGDRFSIRRGNLWKYDCHVGKNTLLAMTRERDCHAPLGLPNKAGDGVAMTNQQGND